MNQLQKIKRVLLVVGLSALSVFVLLFLIIGGTRLVDDVRNWDEKEAAREQSMDESKERMAAKEEKSLEYFDWFDEHNLTLHERLIAYDDVVKNDPDRIEEAKQEIYQSYNTINEFQEIDETTVDSKHSDYVFAVKKICDTLRTTMTNSDDYLEGMHEGLEQLDNAEDRLDTERGRILNDY